MNGPEQGRIRHRASSDVYYVPEIILDPERNAIACKKKKRRKEKKEGKGERVGERMRESER